MLGKNNSSLLLNTTFVFNLTNYQNKFLKKFANYVKNLDLCHLIERVEVHLTNNDVKACQEATNAFFK